MRNEIHVNGLGVSDGIEELFGKMEGELKAAPAGVLPPVTRSLTTKKEWLVSKIADRSPEEVATLQGIATTYLELTRTHFEKAKSLRVHYAQLGREYGLTNQQIGDSLGITEARIRQLLATA